MQLYDGDWSDNNDKVWQTMKAKGISQYDLYTHYNVNRSQLNRLRKNHNVEVNTIDKLCKAIFFSINNRFKLYKKH